MTEMKEASADSNQARGSRASALRGRLRIRRPSRRTIRVGAGVLTVLLLIGGFLYYLHAISFESTDDAFINGHIIPISPRVSGHVARVYVTDNQKVAAGDLLLEIDPRDYQARLDAAQAALHAAEASSRSLDIDVNLTSISSTAGLEESKANVDAAGAMVKNAQALADAARSQEREAEAQLAFARAALTQAQAQQAATNAKHEQNLADLKRARELAEGHIISPQQLERAQTAERMSAADLDADRSKVGTQQSLVKRAVAGLKTAQDNVRQAMAQVAARQGQLEQARARMASARSAPEQVARSTSRAEASRADIEKARAMLAQATLNLSYTKIYAPSDGYVAQKSVEPGAFVQVGQSLMAVVSPHVWVTANFKETQLTDMRPGQPAVISVDTFPGVTFHGHVESIQRGTGSRFSLLPPENATGNFVKVVQRIPVKIVFDRPREQARYLLVPGMSVVPVVDIAGKVAVKTAGEGLQAADRRDVK